MPGSTFNQGEDRIHGGERSGIYSSRTAYKLLSGDDGGGLSGMEMALVNKKASESSGVPMALLSWQFTMCGTPSQEGHSVGS